MVKQLLFLLITLVSIQVSAVAQDALESVSLTFDIDDAARVRISVNGEELEELQSGINKVEVNPWSNLEIAPDEGCVLVSVADADGVVLTLSGNAFRQFIGDSFTEATYKVTTAFDSGISFTIEVDNPDKVSCSTKDYQPILLNAGKNEISLSSSELPLMIGAAKYGQEIYSVTMDGEEQPYNYGYAVTPAMGSVIVITADFPDKECRVEFLTSEGIVGFFTAIEVNSEDIDDFANGITVKCGDQIKLYFNQYCWLTADEGTPIKVTINGEETSWFGPGYSFTIKENTVVNVEQAVPTEMIPVTIDIDNPKNVIIYRNSNFFKDILSLSEGMNSVDLPKEYANLVIESVENSEIECRIDGVTVNGRPKNVEYYNYMEIEDLDEDDKVVIYTSGFGSTDVTDLTIDNSECVDIYNIYGVMVKSNATMEQTLSLPKGLYIRGNQKIIIK